MPQYYTLQDQRRIERVPRPPHLSPPYESIPPITFSANSFPGVRLKDLLKGRVTIDAANDAVLGQHGFRTIVVSLEVRTVASLLCSLFSKQYHSGQAMIPGVLTILCVRGSMCVPVGGI